ncbi:MAG: GNAT family N-acetyltransferase [Anaerolineae bacterium]|nr:GNAT family N-acetyltransferase [Anaerolineae bacterium]
MLQAVRQAAIEAGCRRVWLVTTNDNLNALRCYQKRGCVLVAVHQNAVEEARKLKPTIPQTGYEGIPIRDEIELELTFPSAHGAR